jgi:deoxyadenosine/deoxycytidine kinase
MDKTAHDLLIGIVGPCGAGKTSLVLNLSPRYSRVRAIAQEHSYVPDMWRRITNPDILIYLDASYAMTIQRRHLDWTEEEYKIEIDRLAHARNHADIHIATDHLNLKEVAEEAFDRLDHLIKQSM